MAMCHATVNIKGFAHALHGAELFYIQIYRHVAVIVFIYKYEKPLVLKGYGTVYPDFTLLSPHNYEELYWEHEGRMDDHAYAASAVKKIKSYEENGVYAGERLILTFETQKTVLNTGDIERVVNRFLK